MLSIDEASKLKLAAFLNTSKGVAILSNHNKNNATSLPLPLPNIITNSTPNSPINNTINTINLSSINSNQAIPINNHIKTLNNLAIHDSSNNDFENYLIKRYNNKIDIIRKKPDEIYGECNMRMVSTYCGEWTVSQAGREFLQNWLDGLSYDSDYEIKYTKIATNNYIAKINNLEVGSIYIDSQKSITIVNNYVALSTLILNMGSTTKGNAKQAGGFGEGLKVGINKLLALNYRVKYYTAGKKWDFYYKQNSDHHNILHVNITDNTEEQYNFLHTYVVIESNNNTITDVFDVFKFLDLIILDYQNINKLHLNSDIYNITILNHSFFSGKIYCRGIFIAQDSYKFPGYGIGISSAVQLINRDRSSININDIISAIIYNIEIIKNNNKILEFFWNNKLELFNNGNRKIKIIFINFFKHKYGENAYPIESYNAFDKQLIINTGKLPILVTRTQSYMLSYDGSIGFKNIQEIIKNNYLSANSIDIPDLSKKINHLQNICSTKYTFSFISIPYQKDPLYIQHGNNIIVNIACLGKGNNIISQFHIAAYKLKIFIENTHNANEMVYSIKVNDIDSDNYYPKDYYSNIDLPLPGPTLINKNDYKYFSESDCLKGGLFGNCENKYPDRLVIISDLFRIQWTNELLEYYSSDKNELPDNNYLLNFATITINIVKNVFDDNISKFKIYNDRLKTTRGFNKCGIIWLNIINNMDNRSIYINLFSTICHEYAHNHHSSHNENFSLEMQANFDTYGPKFYKYLNTMGLLL